MADAAVSGELQPPLLRAGETCWRVAEARRAAYLVDGADYYAAVKAAMRNARESIFIAAWDFDGRTRLSPEHPEAPDELASFISGLLHRRASLRVRVLKWRMPFAIAIQEPKLPLKLRNWMSSQRVQYRVDNQHPTGACHHQKIVVIDDAMAFCGGSDFLPNRWDTPNHRDDDPFRVLPSGKLTPPRHDVMMAVDGDAALALAALARERWAMATGKPFPEVRVASDPWPEGLRPDLTDITIGISRTHPAWKARPEAREIEALTLEAIARARRSIYLETQYFASSEIGAALAARLGESDGPAIVVVCPGRSPSYFDHMAMDPIRNSLIRTLRDADRYGRFRIYKPITAKDVPIIVHSKVTVIDERLLKIGSSNINNRSMGFDTECDLAIEAAGPVGAEIARSIAGFRTKLLAEHLGAAPERVSAISVQSGLIAAIDALNPDSGRRLSPVTESRVSVLDPLIMATHLWDPLRVSDAWRPWKPRRKAEAEPP